ncbi:hypothetical protein LZ32DRAFT_318769 [Colletotrichum eremochloae]|nr:hypothetical protein LZ32DRAFT_318769 [Colletotrichum eremochloae]
MIWNYTIATHMFIPLDYSFLFISFFFLWFFPPLPNEATDISLPVSRLAKSVAGEFIIMAQESCHRFHNTQSSRATTFVNLV